VGNDQSALPLFGLRAPCPKAPDGRSPKPDGAFEPLTEELDRQCPTRHVSVSCASPRATALACPREIRCPAKNSFGTEELARGISRSSRSRKSACRHEGGAQLQVCGRAHLRFFGGRDRRERGIYFAAAVVVNDLAE